MRSNPAHKNEPKRLAAHDGKNGIDRSSENSMSGPDAGARPALSRAHAYAGANFAVQLFEYGNSVS
jgi:hypothetical protein